MENGGEEGIPGAGRMAQGGDRMLICTYIVQIHSRAHRTRAIERQSRVFLPDVFARAFSGPGAVHDPTGNCAQVQPSTTRSGLEMARLFPEA